MIKKMKTVISESGPSNPSHSKQTKSNQKRKKKLNVK